MIRIQRDGTILRDGAPVGHVMKTEGLASAMGKWRAEVGDPAVPTSYRVVYAGTRKAAVAEVIT